MKDCKKNKIKKGETLEIYTDGASRGNPGPSACAFIFVKNDEIIHKYSEYLGNKTNNEAEYNAIIKALKKAVEFTRWDIKIYSDSQLVVNQINGEWRIKKEHLKELYQEVVKEKQNFKSVEFLYSKRENKFIKEVDTLCNQCLDNYCR